ncbi:nucleoporin GLE1-like [Alligator mississippiensis]|uniref:Nucleoporin GLE1-like n=1 Tax=Alligator mississippiensis TaxID=8496 RepID=A0A151MN14_ALLMI|nr:nucleoporin GLE1-like [Alligator mississippiensis]
MWREGQMDPPSSIEVDYIKNLQKQVYLLELETSFLREQAKKVTSIQPKITIQAGKLLQKMKELHLEMNNAQLKLGRKESHTELHQKIQQHEDMEAKLAESRSECLRLQALLHQLEENHLSSSQSGQQHIAKELCEEAQKLREVLKEKELSADENKYLRNKVAENCGHLTKENGFLQSQVLEASKHLDRERQLREEESTCNSRRISELVSRKEKERQLELKLTYLKGLLQDERKKVLPIREQISEKDDEIRHMHGHANTMVQDLNSLKSQVDTEHTLTERKLETACQYSNSINVICMASFIQGCQSFI